jgi:hypothetical protein
MIWLTFHCAPTELRLDLCPLYYRRSAPPELSSRLAAPKLRPQTGTKTQKQQQRRTLLPRVTGFSSCVANDKVSSQFGN